MDINTIKQIAFQYLVELKKNKIKPDIIILFGSQAQGRARDESDIDLAIVSRQFGKDRIEEGAKLNFIAAKIDPRIEAIPISTKEYLNPRSISPILHEIKKDGIALF